MIDNFILIEDSLINISEILYTERNYDTDDLKIVMKNGKTFIIDSDKREDILNTLVRLTQAERQD